MKGAGREEVGAVGHTPGPWQRGEYDDFLGYDCMTGGIRVGPVVLDANRYGQRRSYDEKPWDRERMEADASLIAAAPDLLAACEGCADLLRMLDRLGFVPGGYSPDGALADAEAAIAKARGQTNDVTPTEKPTV